MSEDAARAPRGDLSPSSLAEYVACPESYRLHHVVRAPKEGAGQAGAARGTAVHAALEEAARRRIEGELDRDEPVRKKELRSILDEHTPDDPAELEEALDLVSGIPTLDFSRASAVEESFAWRPGDDGPLVVGIWDRVDLDRERGIVHVIDYKTGQPKTTKELRSEPQTLIYLAAAREVFRDEWGRLPEVCVTYHYLSTGHMIPVWWSPMLDALARAWVRGIWYRIRSEAFPARPGKACTWCRYTSRCKAYGPYVDRLAKADATEPSDPRWNDHAWLLTTRKALKRTQKDAETAVSKIDAVVKALMESGPVSGGGLRAIRRKRTNTDFDPRALAAVAAESGSDLAELVLKAAQAKPRNLRNLAADLGVEDVLQQYARDSVSHWIDTKAGP